jgi:hypothetical protein
MSTDSDVSVETETDPSPGATGRPEAPSAPGRSPARPWRVRPSRSFLSLWLPAILIAIVTTRYRHITLTTWELSPQLGLDESWRAGLAMAAHHGLHFGPDLLFTYGPLGFLESGGLYFTGTAALSALFVSSLHLAVIVAVLWRLRRSFRPWIAVVLTLAFAELIRYVGATETLVIPVLVLGTAVIEDDAHPTLRRWIVPIAALSTALAVLMKADAGITLIAVSLVIVWFASPGRYRSELHYAGLSTALFFVGWLVSGNRIGDIPNWLAGVYQLATGYSAAMGSEVSPRSEYLLVPVAASTVAVLVYLSTRNVSRSRKVGVWLVVLVAMYIFFRHSFVRHDKSAAEFFILCLLVALALGWRQELRKYALPGLAVLLLCALFTSGPQHPFSDMNPAWTVPTAVRQVRDLAVPSDRHRLVAESRASLQRIYRLEPQTLASLRGKTVHIDPWETQVAWAYPQLRWNPLPVFQSYAAYTPALDRKNAARLASPRGPEAILRSGRWLAAREGSEGGAVDNRNPDFESPDATLSMLCHYQQVNATQRWQVLARAPNRCGHPESLGVVKASLGKPVQVPSANDQSIVVAHVRGLYGALVQRVQSVLFKSSPYDIRLDGEQFTLVPATASGPLVMSTPSNLGYSEGFGFQRKVRSLEVTVRSRQVGPSTFDVAFYRIPLTPAT